MALGAPGADPGGRRDAGSVLILSGASGEILQRFDGEADGDLFGFALDADDRSLYVGAPGIGAGGPPGPPGSVYAYTIEKGTWAPPSRVTGDHPGMEFGSVVRALPDLDGEIAPRTLHQRVEPGHELREGERLRQVVVAAGLQAFHAIVDGPFRAQDEDRRRHAALAKRVDQGQPVALGEHDVDNRDVVRLADGRLESGVAVCEAVDAKTCLAQAALDKSGDRVVVFDQKRTHDCYLIVRRGEGVISGRRKRA